MGGATPERATLPLMRSNNVVFCTPWSPAALEMDSPSSGSLHRVLIPGLAPFRSLWTQSIDRGGRRTRSLPDTEGVSLARHGSKYLTWVTISYLRQLEKSIKTAYFYETKGSARETDMHTRWRVHAPPDTSVFLERSIIGTFGSVRYPAI